MALGFGLGVLAVVAVIKIAMDQKEAAALYDASYISGGYGIDGRTRKAYSMRAESNRRRWF